MRRIAWLNAILSIPASVSFYAALHNAFAPGRFQDFQWSGTYLALHHIDPYKQFLIHDPQHYILLAQVPNYLQELYILLSPLGALSFQAAKPIWTLLNLLFTLLIVLILQRMYTLDRATTVLIALLLVISTPFRIVIAAGNEALFELFFFCLVFYETGPIKRGLALGLSYAKYSFSPVLFLYLLFRKNYKLLAISLLPPLLGLLGMWSLVRGNLTALAVEPLQVSRTGVTPGLGDLMVLIEYAFRGTHSLFNIKTLSYVAAILASAAYAFYLSRQKNHSPQRIAPPLAVASLMFFTHLTYDFVFLIIPLAACLGGAIRRSQIIILSAIGLLWYGIKLVPARSITTLEVVAVCGFLLLAVMLVLLSIQNRQSKGENPDFAGNPIASTQNVVNRPHPALD